MERMENLVDNTCGYYCGGKNAIQQAATANGDTTDTERLSPSELDEPTPASDLRRLDRKIWIVTTASLPWRTGTAVNPFLRGLYLTRNRPSKSVTLVIPWLERQEDREKLYGSDECFSNGMEGMKEQEEWLKRYAEERCNAKEEMGRMGILFYPAIYKERFGSIFPMVDICSLIPEEEADVAILEEPEHLNWIRIPPVESPSVPTIIAPTLPVTSSDLEPTKSAIPLTTTEVSSETITAESSSHSSSSKESVGLGWAHKFTHVIGIIHTNYGSYAKQCGFGIAAPAISTLSALVIRAYCHKVIKLSATLPVFAPGKEIIANVHGVRDEFIFDKCGIGEEEAGLSERDENDNKYAEVYYIGKLLWAKGFDLMLRAQDQYKKDKNEYFAIDIYGGGPDKKAIVRAFHGRPKRTLSPQPQSSQHPQENIKTLSSSEHSTTPKPPSEVFSLPYSLRTQSTDICQTKNPNPVSDDIQKDTIKDNPLSIIVDTAKKSLGTGVATTKAVYHLADNVIHAGLSLAFTFQDSEDQSSAIKKMRFDPPLSRFELRPTPIPARFLGVKDHATLKITTHKIFFNPSISEVLCTTTFEALSMGRFVVIPDHPSNTFFMKFPNCLSYKSMEECSQKIQHALQNDPLPLSKETKFDFTWEAATERLVEASILTRGELEERSGSGSIVTDERIAWFHSKMNFPLSKKVVGEPERDITLEEEQ